MGQMQERIKALLRTAVQPVVGDYALNRIYRREAGCPLPPLRDGWRILPMDDAALAVLRAHPDPKVRKSASFARNGVFGFALWDHDRLAGTVFFEDRTTYYNDALWTLAQDEAALIDLLTLPEHRGRGVAPLLIAYGTNAMFARGMRALIAWIWWTNHPSIRAFEKAGWSYIAFVTQMRPFGKRQLTFRLPRKPTH